MRESVLNALMHLFAIVASQNANRYNSKVKEIARSYLYQHLSKRFASRFVDIFEDYLKKYSALEDLLVLGNEIKKIGNQINKGLSHREKMIVLVRLLELSSVDRNISDFEKELLSQIAGIFNIKSEEFNNILTFCTSSNYESIQNQLLLVVDQNKETEEPEGTWFGWSKPDSENKPHHLYRENVQGQLVFLKVESANMYFFKCICSTGFILKNQGLNADKIYVFDSGSILKGHKIKPIYYFDIVSIYRGTEKKSKIVFTGQNIEFRFKGSKNGVAPFNFSVESGQLIGMLGGSGVGKSTLLNLLNGKIRPKAGKITINGFDLHKNKEDLEGIIGYVPQDDLLIEELTVFQNLFFNARLCLGYLKRQQIEARVNKLLCDLDLESVKNLQVGSPLNKMISGGQRKRLNIALELIREPYLLFVDEPTSGLSSKDSETVMHLLKEQSLKGKLVIANIHQPSAEVFKLFDKLWVMDKGGHIIYQGNPIDSIEYFKTIGAHVDAAEAECPNCGNINTEQVLDIVEEKTLDEFGNYSQERKISPEEWYKSYKQNIESKISPLPYEKQLPLNYFRTPDFDQQMKYFTIRNFLAKISNHQYLIINLLEAPLLAFILGYFSKYIATGSYVFAENKNLPAFLFMSVVVSLFLGMIVSAEEIIKDQKIIERESFLNLSRFSYLNSKIVFLFGLSAIQMFMYVLIANYILEIQGMTLSYWFILFSGSCFANLIGLTISSTLSSVVAVYIAIPFVLVPQILLSGTVVQFDNLHPSLTKREYTPFVGDLMVSRWVYEALAVEQFKNNKYEKYFYPFEKQKSDATYKASFLIPKIEQKLDLCLKAIENDTLTEKQIRDFYYLENGVKDLAFSTEMGPFEYIQKLNPSKFSEEVYEETYDYLQFMKMNFNQKAQIAESKIDSVVTALEGIYGKDFLFHLRAGFYNKSLADYVLNRWELNKIYEGNNKLVRKKDPVFMSPESGFGRAHFYAPSKIFLKQKYDTFWFNITIVWIMSLVLYFFLLFDILKKLLEQLNFGFNLLRKILFGLSANISKK